MKYSVSVVKRITLLIMTMALAVALVACSAATSVKGEQGPQGAQGETGPAGPAGTSDNEPPMVTAPLPMVYLAMAGTGNMKTSKADDLSEHFSDTETPSLDYKFETTNKDVATAELDDDGKMIVKAKGVGSAKITVMVYDNVTEPISETFDVMVVANNARPVVVTDLGVTLPGGDTEAAKLAKKLYIVNGPQTVTVKSSIHAGLAVGVNDDVSFDTAVVMGNKGDTDDIVGVSVKKKPGTVDMWEVTLTPKKAGHQNVAVTVTDMFGAKAEAKWMFQAVVNTVPMKVFDLPATMVLDKSVEAATRDESIIAIDRYFDTVEKSPTGVPTDDGIAVADTATEAQTTAFNAGEATLVPIDADVTAAAHTVATCAYSTSPDQTVDAAPTGDLTNPDTDQAGSAAAEVDAGGVITVNVPIQKIGTFDLTIVCRDEEDSDHDTTKVTVRP